MSQNLTLVQVKERYTWLVFWAFIVLVVAYILQSLPQISETQSPLKLQDVLQYIVTGVQIITGLIVAISLYYIGKIRDRRSDYVKYLGELEEHSGKIQRWLRNITEFDTSYALNTIEELHHHFQNADNRSPRISRGIIGLTMMTITLMISGLFAISFGKTDLGSTIYVITDIFVGSYLVVVLWLMYEDVMSFHDNELRILSIFIGTLKSFN